MSAPHKNLCDFNNRKKITLKKSEITKRVIFVLYVSATGFVVVVIVSSSLVLCCYVFISHCVFFVLFNFCSVYFIVVTNSVHYIPGSLDWC